MNEVLQKVQSIVNELLPQDDSIFVVALKIKPTNNIKLFVDTDEGITIELCIQLNRKLYAALEEQAIFPDGDFSLEVSSPGVGEPILLQRQYKKNMGRWFEIVVHPDSTVLEGKLIGLTETGLQLETTSGKGKKQIIQTNEIPFDHIAKATVVVKF